MQQMRGVNLGGWLVIEKWITPELFDACDASDEHGLCVWSPEEATRRLNRHRETFITQHTIEQIASLGLNTVRLPVGYWLLREESPFIKGADDFVDQLFSWCETSGIGVILDIHAVVGSQNGWDHSGKAGRIGWGDQDTIERTLALVDAIVDRFGKKPSLKAIEVLNEPHWDVPERILLEYYDRAYRLIRERLPDMTIIMSDAFRPERLSKAISKRRYTNVMLDVHLYQLFTDEDRRLNLSGHIHKTEKDWAKLLKKLSRRLPVIVGEWSAAMHELYLPIKQPGHVARYTQQDYVKYFKRQRDVFDEAGVSWTYWTAKTSRGGPWSLLDNPDFLA